MIWHVVMWRVKGEGGEKEENISEIINMLRELKKIIPQLRVLHVGKNFSKSSNAFDVALVSGFESKEDLEDYRNHPEHKRIVEKINKKTYNVTVVDFEE